MGHTLNLHFCKVMLIMSGLYDLGINYSVAERCIPYFSQLGGLCEETSQLGQLSQCLLVQLARRQHCDSKQWAQCPRRAHILCGSKTLALTGWSWNFWLPSYFPNLCSGKTSFLIALLLLLKDVLVLTTRLFSSPHPYCRLQAWHSDELLVNEDHTTLSHQPGLLLSEQCLEATPKHTKSASTKPSNSGFCLPSLLPLPTGKGKSSADHHFKSAAATKGKQNNSWWLTLMQITR